MSNPEAATLSEKEGRPMPWRQQLRGRFEVWMGTGIVLYLASWTVGQMISFESDPAGLPELAFVLSVFGTIALAVGIVVLAVSLVVGPMYEELRRGGDG